MTILNNIGMNIDDIFEYTNTNTNTNQVSYNLHNLHNFINNASLFNSEIFFKLYKSGMAIWLNANGDICYKLSPDDIIRTSTNKKISLVFSNILGLNVKILNHIPNINKKEDGTAHRPTGNLIYYIITAQLPFVKDEYFNPFVRLEFFENNNNFICRNLFRPTQYLKSNQTVNISKSITLQYIYHLANYNEERFHYILNWLASFFNDFKMKSRITMVLIGSEDSGKDILFSKIIQPLFGSQYCIKLNEESLLTDNSANFIKNKLFYNLDNITSSTAKKKQNLLKKLLTNDTITIQSKGIPQEYPNFGQTLITTSHADISYLDKNSLKYIVFKISEKIEDFNNDYLPKNNLASTKENIISSIERDLTSFAQILKVYVPPNQIAFSLYKKDDKSCLIDKLEEKLKIFSKAVIESNRDYFIAIKDNDLDLYNEVMKDFDNEIIKQKNLLKSFIALHEEEEKLHSRTLMVQIRKISDNNGFFEADALKIGAGGMKYFAITRANAI